ncbi:MAG: (2Fe-2S)-binding protein [Tunicatimonas sp.]|uniref:(2Fe-2S)-binding protein n=1 Tax=Tunicatimonas sp. TaxID=1940096 RepID=UPI003C73C3FF
MTIKVNGQTHPVEADPFTPLLYVLRNQLELNGPKYGCGLEQCGACMVLLDGKASPSCRIPVSAVTDKEIVTLKGLIQDDGSLHPVQQAFEQEQTPQCGYCLNGMIIAAVALLEENDQPDDNIIREKMQPVLCRCGTHARVMQAVRTAAQTMNP